MAKRGINAVLGWANIRSCTFKFLTYKNLLEFMNLRLIITSPPEKPYLTYFSDTANKIFILSKGKEFSHIFPCYASKIIEK